jgi:hypothetical protein
LLNAIKKIVKFTFENKLMVMNREECNWEHQNCQNNHFQIGGLFTINKIFDGDIFPLGCFNIFWTCAQIFVQYLIPTLCLQHVCFKLNHLNFVSIFS